MDEVAEQQEIANEISDAISNPVGFGNEVDEVCSCHLEEHTLCFFLPRTKKITLFLVQSSLFCLGVLK